MKRTPFSVAAGLLPLRGPRARRTARGLPRLLGELVIVFVGVYAAFALSEFQQEREREQRREQLRHALMEEIEDIVYNTRNVSFFAAHTHFQLDSLHAAGETPPLQPFMEPLRVETHMWDAALASGALDLLDVPTTYRMSRFYNQLNAGFEQFAQLRQLSQSMIVPHAEQGIAAFYDTETRKLRPQYTWYPDGIRRLGDAASGATRLGEQLIRDLEGRSPRRPRAAFAALEEEARAEAERFLRLVDRGEVRESWAAIAPALQRRFTLEQWEQVMKSRGGWAVEEREAKHQRFEPDKGEGAEYVSLQFEIRPATGRRRLEAISMLREAGAGWKVTNYIVH